MELYRDVDDVPADFGPSAVAIGKFDGVHRGHRAIIRRLERESADHGLDPVVLTFDRNPLAVLDPDRCPPELTSLEQRIELLADEPLAATVVLRFDSARAVQEADVFARDVLIDRLGASLVVSGADFRFGARGVGDIGLLRRLGLEVVVVDDVEYGDARTSSTAIRGMLAEGDVRAAAAALGRRHRIRSRVVHGEHRGRELGVPTANLDPAIEGFVPADGIYAGRVFVDGERYPAAVSIGNNPTFEGVPQRQVEAHLLDVDLDLYGRDLEVEFVERLHGMLRYDSLDALVAGMADDVRRTREVLATEPS